jgi:fructose-1,6-bisphosphatase/inositol monophosphatase family enzyme
VIDDVSGLLRDVAGTVVLPRFRRLRAEDVREKGPGDLVTVADQEAERALSRGLTRLLPGSTVVAEESVAADPALLHRLAGDGPVWVVDPLDGTANFAAGRTPFVMMVALLRDGEAAAAWILDVADDRLTVAEAGSGTYVDGVRVKARADDPGPGGLRGAVNTRYLPDHLRFEAASHAERFAAVTPGRHCAGWEYPAVATDDQQFTLFWRVLPWDHVPGALILTEAGGTVRHLDGSGYRATDREPGLLIAPNEGVWQTVRDTLFP